MRIRYSSKRRKSKRVRRGIVHLGPGVCNLALNLAQFRAVVLDGIHLYTAQKPKPLGADLGRGPLLAIGVVLHVLIECMLELENGLSLFLQEPGKAFHRPTDLNLGGRVRNADVAQSITHSLNVLKLGTDVGKHECPGMVRALVLGRSEIGRTQTHNMAVVDVHKCEDNNGRDIGDHHVRPERGASHFGHGYVHDGVLVAVASHVGLTCT